MENLSFEEFARFIRSWGHISKTKTITPATRFELDLGIFGGDGDDLLKAAEKKFDVSLCSERSGYRDTFNLEPDEYLFSAEGAGPVWGLISIFDCPHVREFTVGELYEAVRKALNKKI